MEKEFNRVKKKLGAYYSPPYIADYICRNTIIPFLSKHNKYTVPDLINEYLNELDLLEEKLKNIKIIDPSCGAGIFLLKSIEILFEIYNKINEINRRDPSIDNQKEKQIFLVNILENNIFGIDIDPKSIEITKKNLILKFCSYNDEINEKPRLDETILCGNALFEEEIIKNINPFKWELNFPDVFKKGGFDIVVGNPPYVDIKELDPELTQIIFSNYSSANNRTNLFSVFIERIINKILNEHGFLGLIIPNSLLYNSSYRIIRKILIENSEIKTIIRLPDKIFKEVSVETIILVLKRCSNPKNHQVDALIYGQKDKIDQINNKNCKYFRRIDPSYWKNNENYRFQLIDEKIQQILKKIEENTIPLADTEEKNGLCDVSLGITPYDKYKGHSSELIKNKKFHADSKLSEDFKPLLSGADIKRYNISWSGNKFIKYGKWLGASREKRFFLSPRIIVRQIVSGNPQRIYAAFTDKELYNTQIAFNIILKDNKPFKLRYILAILNSNLMNYYHKFKFLDETKTVFQKILIENAKNFPIKKVPQNIQSEICVLVENLEKSIIKEEDPLSAEIEAIEDKIDKKIYELYNIKLEETENLKKAFS